MAGMFEGIGTCISELFGVEHKPVADSLEKEINEALTEEREKIRPSRDDVDKFSWVTGDNNPIHRLRERARKLGFEDIPIMGAHLAAYGEQYVERVVQNMRAYWGADIKIIGQDNSFKGAVYPGDKILWKVIGFRKKDSCIELNVIGTTKDAKVIEITAKLGKEYKPMEQIAGPIFFRKYLLHEEHLDAFYNCVGGKNEGRVPNMLPAAYVPATLLELLKERTQTMEGMNLIMNFNFISEVRTGKMVQVDIFPPREPRERKVDDKETGQKMIEYIYKFKTVCSQDTKPALYGEIISSTPHKGVFY